MGYHCKNSVPKNKKLYNSIKNKIKSRSKVWPSAYASGQLVREYKSKGGKYGCSFGSLDRWFKEKWVNVCKPKGKSYERCGRNKSQNKNYPYCRPLKRVNKQTPRTVGEIGKSKLKIMCKRKRKNPRKKVFLFGENKNNNNIQEMEKNFCGFGKRRSRFGENLSATNSNLDSFYKNGSADSSNLTSGITSCLSSNYGGAFSRFGKKANFIQKANEQSRKKGTVGSFTRWCKKKGFPKVTTACISEGKKSKSLTTRRRAIFAQNIRSKKRSCSFGDSDRGFFLELKEKRKKEYLELDSAQLQQQLEENQQSYNYEIIGSTSDEIENMKILYLDSINEAIEERKRLMKSIRYREERRRLKPRHIKFGNTHVIFREIKYLKSL